MSDLSKLLDAAEQSLWDNVFGREYTRPDIFSMKDARKFLMECAADEPSVKQLAIDIEREGQRFKVSLVALDGNKDVIYTGKNTLMGRQLIAERLHKDVNEFMNGETMQYLSIKDCLDM